MQKRREHIADAGVWVLPGGEVQRGETATETLMRVCGEELGMSVRPSKQIGTLKLGNEMLPVWRVLWRGEELSLSHESVIGVGWFTLEELETLQPVRHEVEFRDFLKSHAENLVSESLGEGEDFVSKEEREAELDRKRLAELVAKAQDGDHLAFGHLYDVFIQPIYRYVAFRVHPGIAEDLTADIFVKAWEKLGTYKVQKGTPFSSWLFRIARNVVIDSYRMQREHEELDEFHEDEDRWNDPSLAIAQELQSTLLRQAMQELPKRYREVLLLSFMADLGNGEIAHALKMREGGVRILKHRALKKLSSLLPASMREEVP
jgi:RNA polymerase sigma-70 factor (ECF subfamily)